MFNLSITRQIIGLLLIFLSWRDPFSMGSDFQIVAFILGFDMMTLLPKIIIFGIDYFWDISGYGLFLLIQLTEDIIFDFFLIGRMIELLIKPSVVFFIIFINGFGFWLAFITAFIDFILNWQKKIV